MSTSTSAVSTSALLRSKTSLTMLGRRYRTNLNARIQSLHMAVPALRVLEDKECGKRVLRDVSLLKGLGLV